MDPSFCNQLIMIVTHIEIGMIMKTRSLDVLEDTQKQRMTTSPNTVGQSSGINESPPQGDKSSDDDEDNECKIMDSAFEPIPENVEDRIQPDASTKITEDDEKDYLGEE